MGDKICFLGVVINKLLAKDVLMVCCDLNL